MKNTISDVDTSELATFRKQIDEIDEKLVALLLERIKIVQQVGSLKASSNPGQCPIRPGREASMVRNIMRKFENSAFLPAAAANIWRLIIGMSTTVESPLTLSVFATDKDNDLFWMAREYFGSFVSVTKQPHINRVIGDVMDGKAFVGILPMLHSSDTLHWWTNLLQPGKNDPKVFARIPFIDSGTPGRDAPSALAIARITPEESGDDQTLLVLETEYNVRQHKLQTAMATAKLEARWINIATLNPASRHHLIEIKGFITEEHPGMQALRSALASSLTNATILGAYAVPVVIHNANNKRETHATHATIA